MNQRPALPSLFVSHGSPMIAIEPLTASAFLAQLGPALDATFGRPKAIVAVSAHSLTREPALLAAAQHETAFQNYFLTTKLRYFSLLGPNNSNASQVDWFFGVSFQF